MDIKKHEDKIIYISSFLMPILIVLAVMLLLNIFPFGENSFLYWDSKFEYLNYFSYLKTIFTSNNDFLYSLSRFGGSNMAYFNSFYNYFSPLNFIFLLFPDKYLNIGLEFLMILKIGLCGLSCAYFLNHEVKKTYFVIPIAASLALCEHSIITLMTNYVLFDGIVLLPLAAVGVSKVIEKNDNRLLILALFLNILCNGHSGLIAILFSFIYFFYKILLKNKAEFKLYFSKIKDLIFSSLVASLLCAWILIPVVFDLGGGKYDFFDFKFGFFDVNISFFKLFKEFLTGGPTYPFYFDKYPFLFFGVVNLAFMVLYFCNLKIPKKERIVSGIFLVILYACFFFNFLFMLFNAGIEKPCGTIYRFGYIQILFSLLLAYKSIVEIKSAKNIYILSGFGILGLIFLIILLSSETLDYGLFYSDMTIIIAVLLFIFLALNISKGKYFIYFIAIPLVLNLYNLFNETNIILGGNREFVVSGNVNGFTKYVEAGKKAVNYIKNSDKGFYRIETGTRFYDADKDNYSNNMPMLFNYNAISHYSSSGDKNLKNFYENIGFPAFHGMSVAVSYEDFIQNFPLSLMGVKYLITSEILSNPYILLKTFENDKYKLNVYKNPYAFPVGFLIDDKKINDNYEFKNITDYQNYILKNLSSNDYGESYKELHNVDFTHCDNDFDANKISYDMPFSSDMLEGNKNLFVGVLNDNKKVVVQFFQNFCVNDYCNKAFKREYSYQIQNVKRDSITGDKIKVVMKNLDLYNIDAYSPYKYNLFLLSEDMDIFEKYFNDITKNPVNLEKITSSHLKAELNIEENNKLLVLTIPYEKSWKIKINGKKRDAIKILDTFIAIPVFEDDKLLEMKYIPKGHKLGLILSLLGVILLISNIFYRRKTKNNF